MTKFELMYYLGIDYRTMMLLDIPELQFYYQSLRKVKEQEADVEKAKLEVQLAAMGYKKAKESFIG